MSALNLKLAVGPEVPKALRAARNRRLRKKYNLGRTTVKLPRPLKKRLKKQVTNWHPRHVRIESYEWVHDGDEFGGSSEKLPGFHIPRAYGRYYGGASIQRLTAGQAAMNLYYKTGIHHD